MGGYNRALVAPKFPSHPIPGQEKLGVAPMGGVSLGETPTREHSAGEVGMGVLGLWGTGRG